MLEINHLVKKFGPLTAVDGVSFAVAEGEVLGFLGPNGAGKSTTMKMITGFLAPTSGTAVICGHDIETEPLAAKRRIGYLPEGAPAYPDMTTAEFLDFVAHIRGLHGVEARRRIGYIADLIHIAVRLDLASGEAATIAAELRERPGVAAVEITADEGQAGLCVFAQDGQPISDAIVRFARERGWPVTGLYVERGRLDDVFRTITAPLAQNPLPHAA